MGRPTCSETGLDQFERKQTAHQSAHDRNRDGGTRLRVHQCRHCDGFHLAEASAFAPEWQKPGRWKRRLFRKAPMPYFDQPLGDKLKFA